MHFRPVDAVLELYRACPDCEAAEHADRAVRAARAAADLWRQVTRTWPKQP